MTKAIPNVCIDVIDFDAERHAENCREFLFRDQLAKALEYCAAQNIDPPKCSLTAVSTNAHKLREIAKGMLSDPRWWKKRLKVGALRNFEHEQIKSGNVNKGLSDAVLNLMKIGK